MKKIYYLSTCNTCRKVLEELKPPTSFELQDIKIHPIDEEELEVLKGLIGSYSALFNKRAQLYRKLNLANQELTEEDCRKYILEHYTFLKRPIIVVDQIIFAGSPSKIVSGAKSYMFE